jgi:hypothetical protein
MTQNKRTTWPVHWIAECSDCGWRCESRNAQAVAAIHARVHHHRVTGEIGLAFEYDGRNETEEREAAKP